MPAAQDILLNLAFTIVYYGLAPMYLIFFRKKPITNKTVSRICIIYTVVAFFALSFVFASIDGSIANAAPAVIWFFVWRWLVKKQLKRKGILLDMPSAEPQATPNKPDSDSQRSVKNTSLDEPGGNYSDLVEQLIDSPSPHGDSIPVPHKHATRKTIFAVVLIAALIVLNIYQFVENQALSESLRETHEDLYSAKSEINILEFRINRIRPKADFMDENIVIVPNDGTNSYHKYGCDFLDLSNYWAYNTEAAISFGYHRCPACNV